MSGSDLTMKSRNRSVEAGTRWADLVATRDLATDREDASNGLYGDVETESPNGGSRTMPLWHTHNSTMSSRHVCLHDIAAGLLHWRSMRCIQ